MNLSPRMTARERSASVKCEPGQSGRPRVSFGEAALTRDAAARFEGNQGGSILPANGDLLSESAGCSTKKRRNKQRSFLSIMFPWSAAEFPVSVAEAGN